MTNWTKLVVWQITMVALMVGVFYGAQAMGISESVAAFVAVAAAFAAVAAVAAVAAAFVAVAAVAAAAFVAVAAAFVAVAAVAAVAFVAAEERQLSYRWVFVSMLVEGGVIAGALMVNGPAGLMTAGAGVALLALLCWLGADAAEKPGPKSDPREAQRQALEARLDALRTEVQGVERELAALDARPPSSVTAVPAGSGRVS